MKSLLLIIGSILAVYLFAAPIFVNNSRNQEANVFDAITGATKHAKKQKQKKDSKKEENRAKSKQTNKQ